MNNGELVKIVNQVVINCVFLQIVLVNTAIIYYLFLCCYSGFLYFFCSELGHLENICGEMICTKIIINVVFNMGKLYNVEHCMNFTNS